VWPIAAGQLIGNAQASAVLYSLVCSAKANGLEPYSYLRELFEKLPAMGPEETDAIEALLPWRGAERQTQATDSKESGDCDGVVRQRVTTGRLR
jgi:hypothetical protein